MIIGVNRRTPDNEELWIFNYSHKTFQVWLGSYRKIRNDLKYYGLTELAGSYNKRTELWEGNIEKDKVPIDDYVLTRIRHEILKLTDERIRYEFETGEVK